MTSREKEAFIKGLRFLADTVEAIPARKADEMLAIPDIAPWFEEGRTSAELVIEELPFDPHEMAAVEESIINAIEQDSRLARSLDMTTLGLMKLRELIPLVLGLV